MVIKTKKTKKAKKLRGNTNYGHGARKKRMGKGHKGGKGLSGTGKRADQKKSLIIKKYGGKYFGKKGMTSIRTIRDKTKKINLGDIELNFESLNKKFGTKNKELNLKDYKILGKGNFNLKISIIAKQASKSAKEKIEKAGSKIILSKQKEIITQKETKVKK